MYKFMSLPMDMLKQCRNFRCRSQTSDEAKREERGGDDEIKEGNVVGETIDLTRTSASIDAHSPEGGAVDEEYDGINLDSTDENEAQGNF